MKRFDQTGIKVLRVTDAIEHTAKAIFTRYDDKEFSFVDCTSFALIDHPGLIMFSLLTATSNSIASRDL